MFHSRHIAIYMACMLLTAHLFVVFYEEPTLRKQFGEEYDRYRASVPRWIPRFRLPRSSNDALDTIPSEGIFRPVDPPLRCHGRDDKI